MLKRGTRASGHHPIDEDYERSFEAYSRGPKALASFGPVGRMCGCVQNLLVRPRCFDCPALDEASR